MKQLTLTKRDVNISEKVVTLAADRVHARWRLRSRTPRFPGFFRDKNIHKPPASRLQKSLCSFTSPLSPETLRLLYESLMMPASSLTENQGIDDPDLFEGDMILTPEQRRRAELGLDVDEPSSLKRASIRSNLWPSGVVVYDIHSDLGTFL